MTNPIIPDPTVGVDAQAQGAEHSLQVPALIFDRDDKHSIINLVTGEIKKALESLAEHYYDRTEQELRRRCKPTHVDNCLRVSFWREFDRACSVGEKRILPQNVFGGICSEQYFYGRFLKNPKKVAWLVRPVQAYQKHMEAILVRGTQRLEELVDMDIMGKDGRIDVKRAELLLKVVQEVGNRVKGLAIQKIHQRSDSLRLTANLNKPPVALQAPSVDELREHLAKLSATSQSAMKPQQAEVIDAETESVSTDGDREIVMVGVSTLPKDPGLT